MAKPILVIQITGTPDYIDRNLIPIIRNKKLLRQFNIIPISGSGEQCAKVELLSDKQLNNSKYEELKEIIQNAIK